MKEQEHQERDQADYVEEYYEQKELHKIHYVFPHDDGVYFENGETKKRKVGFVRLVDFMGDDEAIVEAARVSYKKADKTKIRSNEGLIRYLGFKYHDTPFEMCEVKFHICCPIFVARQWMRHRTASYNEISGRYSKLENVFYLPETMRKQSKKNKQGSSEEELSAACLQGQEDVAKICSNLYKDLIRQEAAKELARIGLPVSTYTEFYVKTNLKNLFHFINLRDDDHAQYEIRVYAQKMREIVRELFPLASKAFDDYRFSDSTYMEDLEDKITTIIRFLPNELNEELIFDRVYSGREFSTALDNIIKKYRKISRYINQEQYIEDKSLKMQLEKSMWKIKLHEDLILDNIDKLLGDEASMKESDREKLQEAILCLTCCDEQRTH